jgi:cytoskeletal protein CcmA (bactofilin family)
MSITLWTVLFFVLTAALLALPFYPAWTEWRHPVDTLALAFKDRPLQDTVPVSAQVRLEPMSATPAMVSASVRILASSGSRFQKLTAPTILLGTASQPYRNTAHAPLRTVLQTIPHSQKWGTHGWRIQGDCHIPDAQQVTGPLVVMGSLTVGADCLLDGDIKAHGAVQIGSRSQVQGALFSEHAIALHEDVRVQGPVVSQAHVDLGSGVTVGSLEHPSTLSTPHMLANPGAVVHGTVWATQSGRVA